MTNFLMDATHLQVFNGEGKLITEFTQNARTHLSIDGNNSKFSIENATIDLSLLASTGEIKPTHKKSDFENKLSGEDNKTTIQFKKLGKYNKSYKIIANGILYDTETELKSHDFNIVLHNLHLDSPIAIDAVSGKSFSPGYTFKIEEDEDGNFVDLELIEI